jgi:predicted site-specific integrase-resolvase
MGKSQKKIKPSDQTRGGQRRYDIKKLHPRRTSEDKFQQLPTIAYGRLSSHDQKYVNLHQISNLGKIARKSIGRIYPFHLKATQENRFKSSQIEQKNEVNIKLILTSFFCSI